MDSTLRERFAFLAEAFHGLGGFAPLVSWEWERLTTKDQDGNTLTAARRVPKLAQPCHLVPYPREGVEKFAARAAVAVYENHLREACERFVGFLGRRLPMRAGVDAPLVQLLLQNADMRGTPLNEFLATFALEAKARGSMILLLDMPGQPEEDAPVSLQDQIARRAVPYLRSIPPEAVEEIDLDDETGLVEMLSIRVRETVDGKEQMCVRSWDAETWTLSLGERVIARGVHPFGQCPAIAFTESGGLFPVVGKFAQIADLSRRIFNARSELDEILRGQTFSLLTLQIPPEAAATFDTAKAAAGIGTHSMLVHQGDTPAFIAPDSGPAATYLAVIEQLQTSIARVSMQDTTADKSAAAESGVARRLRFERLNSDLASFAHKLQALERAMWAMWHRALGTTNRVEVEWPSDFNLVDSQAELDILAQMQMTGFPAAVLTAKREAIVAAEFDASDETVKADLLAAVQEQAQEPAQPEPSLLPTGA